MSSQNREGRSQDFKFRGLTQEECRRRREETTVEIRRQKREDSLNKRRNLVAVDSTTTPADTSAAAASQIDADGTVGTMGYALAQRLPNMTQGLYSQDLAIQETYAREFRKVLSKERNPPIAEVIQCGVVPRLVQFLHGQANIQDDATRQAVERVQFEAAWALTNIASGTSEQTRVILEQGALPIFISFLQHPNLDLREQSAWALGNIAGDCPEFRDAALNNAIMAPLLTLLENELQSPTPHLSLLRNSAWTLSNLCRGKPSPDWNLLSPAVSVLVRLLDARDDETLVDTAWALSYIVDGTDVAIDAVLRAGAAPKLVRLIGHRNNNVQTPALRAIGNIVTGNEYETQVAIDSGALPALLSLLSHPKATMQKEACWAISNITAGSTQQIQAVIEANIVPPLLHLMSYADYRTKKEACWAICNATSAYAERPDIIRFLIEQGCIKPLCDLLATPDPKLPIVVLDGIANILEAGEMLAAESPEGTNPYALHVEEAGGMDRIYDLQQHDNTDIYRKSKAIIDRFFGEEEEEEHDLAELIAAGRNGDSAQLPQGGFSF